MHLLTGICCVGFLLFPMGIFFEVFPQLVALKWAQWVSLGSVVTPGAYRHLLTGISYMLPMVVAGGLCIALSFVFGIHAADEPGTLVAALMQIGSKSALALMVPVLARFIAFSIAEHSGLTPGLVGGCWLSAPARVSTSRNLRLGISKILRPPETGSTDGDICCFFQHKKE